MPDNVAIDGHSLAWETHTGASLPPMLGEQEVKWAGSRDGAELIERAAANSQHSHRLVGASELAKPFVQAQVCGSCWLDCRKRLGGPTTEPRSRPCAHPTDSTERSQPQPHARLGFKRNSPGNERHNEAAHHRADNEMPLPRLQAHVLPTPARPSEWNLPGASPPDGTQLPDELGELHLDLLEAVSLTVSHLCNLHAFGRGTKQCNIMGRMRRLLLSHLLRHLCCLRFGRLGGRQCVRKWAMFSIVRHDECGCALRTETADQWLGAIIALEPT